MENNSDALYIEELERIANSCYMCEYEDIYGDFMITQYYYLTHGELEVVLRSDLIVADTFLHIRSLNNRGVAPKYILSTSDVQKKYKAINNIKIITVEELQKLDTSKMMLLIINRESDFGICTQIDYREDAFDFPIRERARIAYCRDRSSENFYYYIQHKDEYFMTLKMLEDEESKECFVEIMRAHMENDIYRKKQYSQKEKYFDNTIYKANPDEVWINCGAATGDTIISFINSKRKCKKIYAVDTDSRMIEKLERLKKFAEIYTDYDIDVVPKLLQKGDASIDNLFANDKVSLINMDVEGAEQQILESAEKTIREKAPVLAICAYHKPEDLVTIPQYVKNINKDYHFFLRKYVGCWPDAMNEYVYYAIPTDRLCSK